MRIVFHPKARDELIESAQFYDSQTLGIGYRFLLSVDHVLAAIQHNPLLHTADQQGHRKWRIKKFPYNLIYKIRGDYIFILAVAHSSRKPGYWILREE